MEIEITNRTAAPYRSICYIECTWPDGSRTRGSGVVVGTNDVLTALHVVFDAPRGGWAATVRVTPGADTLPRFDAPFGTFSDVGRINGRTNNWDQDGDGLLFDSESQFDLALIGLRSRIADSTGTLGLTSTASDFTGTILGYPGDSAGLIQNSGVFADASSRFGVFDLTTGLGGGASGGPLLQTDANGNNFVAGVLSSGNTSDTVSTYAGLFGPSNFEWLTQAINGNNDLIGGSGFVASIGSVGNRGASAVVVDDYSATTSTGGRLTVGVSTSGSIESGGDNDWFRVSLAAGRYRFDVLGSDSGNGNLVDPFVTLYNASGISLGSDDDTGAGRDAQLTLDIASTGTYFLGARSFSDTGTGSYTVRATLLSAAPSPTSTAALTNGTSFNDSFAAANLAVSSTGTARVVAGAGRDLISFTESAANFRLANPGGGDTLTVERINANGTSSAFLETTGVNILQFTNRTLFVVSEPQAQVARLYQAAFDRLPDFEGLDFWLGTRNAGSSVSTIAQAFTTSVEYQNFYRGLGNQAFVERLYQNVLDRPGESAGVNFWVGTLNNGATQAQVLNSFSDSPENISNTQGPQGFVQLVGVNDWW